MAAYQPYPDMKCKSLLSWAVISSHKSHYTSGQFRIVTYVGRRKRRIRTTQDLIVYSFTHCKFSDLPVRQLTVYYNSKTSLAAQFKKRKLPYDLCDILYSGVGRQLKSFRQEALYLQLTQIRLEWKLKLGVVNWKLKKCTAVFTLSRRNATNVNQQ